MAFSPGWFAAAAYSKHGHPEPDYALLEAISPLRAVEQIDVPLLVVHGELAGEGHEYRRADSRQQLIEHIREFLLTYL